MRNKKKVVIAVIAGVALVAIAVYAICTINVISKWSFEQRTVDGRVVNEFRKPGDQTNIELSPDNSHKLLFTHLGVTWFDDMGKDYLVDLSDLNKLTDNPDACSENIASSSWGSLFSESGDKVVWAYHPYPYTRLQKILGYDIKSKSQFEIDTRAELPYKSSPSISGDVVAYQGSNGDDGNQIRLYDMKDKTYKQLTPDQPASNQFPKIIGTKVVWVDRRNSKTTGEDIYGYDIVTNSEFTVSTKPGEQSSFKFNGRYVLYAGNFILPGEPGNDSQNLSKNMGLYLYDTQTNTTTTIVQDSTQVSYYCLSNEPDPRIVWSELVTNDNGTFWAIKQKKVSDASASYISNTSTLKNHQFADLVTGTHIFYSAKDAEDTLGLPYCYKLSNSTHYQLDNQDFIRLTVDDKYVMWTTLRTEENDAVEGENICGTLLP